MSDACCVEAPPSGGASHFGDNTWERLCAFAHLLEIKGEELGLLGPREFQRLWARHILNSLAIIPGIQACHEERAYDSAAKRKESTSNKKDSIFKVADIGSGAGFPGIPVAIVLSDIKFVLIEPMDRRVQWLRSVVYDLDLNNVTVKHARAEECARDTFDVVTARAVAPLKKLVPWGLPLVRPGGSLLALKGARAEKEIDEASKIFEKFHIEWVDIHEETVWGTDEPTRVVDLHKGI